MTRLQEVEQLLDSNLQLITDYSKRIAELIGSVKLNRHDCPMCYIENKTLQFAEVKPNFFCGAGSLKE